MAATSSRGEHAAADREIVISRVISAPRELVFEAFTQVRHLSRWWGPEGFTTTTRSFEFRAGDPWERPGGTTFRFVNDGIESALLLAREAAGDRDVRIAGGAETIQEYLDGGLIDEFSVTLAPVLFGTGIRLFDRVDPDRLALDQARADPSSQVTHLTYTAVKR